MPTAIFNCPCLSMKNTQLLVEVRSVQTQRLTLQCPQFDWNADELAFHLLLGFRESWTTVVWNPGMSSEFSKFNVQELSNICKRSTATDWVCSRKVCILKLVTFITDFCSNSYNRYNEYACKSAMCNNCGIIGKCFCFQNQTMVCTSRIAVNTF